MSAHVEISSAPPIRPGAWEVLAALLGYQHPGGPEREGPSNRPVLDYEFLSYGVMYKLFPVIPKCLPFGKPSLIWLGTEILPPRWSARIKITLYRPPVFENQKEKRLEFLRHGPWKDARKQELHFSPPAPCFTDNLGTFRRHIPQAQATSYFPVWQVPS